MNSHNYSWNYLQVLVIGIRPIQWNKIDINWEKIIEITWSYYLHEKDLNIFEPSGKKIPWRKYLMMYLPVSVAAVPETPMNSLPKSLTLPTIKQKQNPAVSIMISKIYHLYNMCLAALTAFVSNASVSIFWKAALIKLDLSIPSSNGVAELKLELLKDVDSNKEFYQKIILCRSKRL